MIARLWNHCVRGMLPSLLLYVGLLSGYPAMAADRQGESVSRSHGAAAADAYRDASDAIGETVETTGRAVYENICSACHETGLNRAPHRFILEQMTPESVHRALTSGVMQVVATDLTADQKLAVAQYITKRKFGSSAATAAPRMCTGRAARFDRSEPPVFSGWGLDAASTHTIGANVAGFDRQNVKRLKLKWAFGFPNALRARSQPALAGGAIFVGSHDGTVYALDRESGCVRWHYNAVAEVRTGIVVSPWKTGDHHAAPLVYFGDLVGNVYAVSAFTGKLAWKRLMDAHPSTTITGTPTLDHGILYVPVSSLEEGGASSTNYPCCTFRGSVVALDGGSGAETWRTYLVEPPRSIGRNSAGAENFAPSGVPVWNSPAIDEKRGQLYVTTGDNYSAPGSSMSDAIVALDLKSGAVKWAYQARTNDTWNGSCEEADTANCPEDRGPDFDFGVGAVLAPGNDGRDYVLAGQKSGEAYAINPDDGTLAWKRKVGRGGVVGGIHFGIAATGGKVFIPVSDVPDGRPYDMAPQPGLYALDIKTGEFDWRAPSVDVCHGRTFCHPGYGGAITATPDLVLAGSNDGYARIYDSATGNVLWEADTTTDVRTVNGTMAHGGSFGGGAAPLAYKGMLILNSGYGFAGKMPGNVLLIYAVE